MSKESDLLAVLNHVLDKEYVSFLKYVHVSRLGLTREEGQEFTHLYSMAKDREPRTAELAAKVALHPDCNHPWAVACRVNKAYRLSDRKLVLELASEAPPGGHGGRGGGLVRPGGLRRRVCGVSREVGDPRQVRPEDRLHGPL